MNPYSNKPSGAPAHGPSSLKNNQSTQPGGATRLRVGDDRQARGRVTRVTLDADLVTHAFRYKQNNEWHYSFPTTGPKLSRHTKVPRYDPETEKGYQRDEDTKHAAPAAEHVRNGGKFPTSITLSIRQSDFENVTEEVLQESDDGTYAFVELTIPEGTDVWLVDGQHRTAALRMLAGEGWPVENFVMTAVLMVTQDELDEALIFERINNAAKGVDTGLTDRLKAKAIGQDSRVDPKELLRTRQYTRYREWVSIEIMKALVKDDDSPWKGRLQPVTRKDELEAQFEAEDQPIPWAGVTERGMTTSLKDFVKSQQTLGPDRLAGIVKTYWEAVKQIAPDAWDDPEFQGKYLLKKSTGLQVVNLLLPTAYAYATQEEGGVSADTFVTILKRAGIKDDFFAAKGPLDGVLGVGGFKRVVAELEAKLYR